jgi:hypothetical protein
MKKSHQPIGVRRSTGSATASVIEWKSGERRMSVGWPATGLSNSSDSVWAKRVPRLDCSKSLFLSSCIAGSQAPGRASRGQKRRGPDDFEPMFACRQGRAIGRHGCARDAVDTLASDAASLIHEVEQNGLLRGFVEGTSYKELKQPLRADDATSIGLQTST